MSWSGTDGDQTPRSQRSVQSHAMVAAAAPEPPPSYYPYSYPYSFGLSNTELDGNATYCHLQLTPMASPQFPSAQKIQSRMLRAPTPAAVPSGGGGVLQTPLRTISHLPDPFDLPEESISARDVLRGTGTVPEGGSGLGLGGLDDSDPTILAIAATPQNLLRKYGRSESPSGSTISASASYVNPNLYHRQQYHAVLGGGGVSTPHPQQPRPGSASSSAAGSVYSGGGGGGGSIAGAGGLVTPGSAVPTYKRGTSWSLPSPAATSVSHSSGAGLGAGLGGSASQRGGSLGHPHFGSGQYYNANSNNYPPLYSQLQPTLSQRITSTSSYSRPSTASSTAAPSAPSAPATSAATPTSQPQYGAAGGGGGFSTGERSHIVRTTSSDRQMGLGLQLGALGQYRRQ